MNGKESLISELLDNYPTEGVQVTLTFSKDDLIDILNADLSLKNKTNIFDHIVYQVYLKKNERHE